MREGIQGNTALKLEPELEQETLVIKRRGRFMSPEVAARLERQANQRRRQLENLGKNEAEKSSHRILFEHFLNSGDIRRAFLYLAEAIKVGYEDKIGKEEMRLLFLDKITALLENKLAVSDRLGEKLRPVYEQMKLMVAKNDFDERLVTFLRDMVKRSDQQELEGLTQKPESLEQAFVVTAILAFEKAVEAGDVVMANFNLLNLKEAVESGDFSQREYEKRRGQYLKLLGEIKNRNDL